MSAINNIYFIFIVFPLAFILAQAETRRFRMLEAISMVKSQVMSLALGYDDRAMSLESDTKRFKKKCEKSLIRFLHVFSLFLKSDFNNLKKYVPIIIDVEDAIGALSHRDEDFRKLGVPANEISRLSQYINKIMDNFEIIRAYKYYHTSKIVVIFLEFFVILGCIIFTPYYTGGQHFAGIFVGPFIASTFLTVINIQKILDHPFSDEDVLDKIHIDFGDRIKHRIRKVLFTNNKSKKNK